MKKLTLFITAIFISVSFVNFSYAQETETTNGGIHVGAGLMFGTEVEQPGLRIDGTYQINEDIRVTADLGLYLPDKQTFNFFGSSTTITSNFLEFNVNGNYFYYKDTEKGLMAYALAGLNIARVSVDGGGNNASDSEVGINIGTGGEYALDFAKLFAEIKYDIGGFEQLNIGVGLRFAIGE